MHSEITLEEQNNIVQTNNVKILLNNVVNPKILEQSILEILKNDPNSIIYLVSDALQSLPEILNLFEGLNRLLNYNNVEEIYLTAAYLYNKYIVNGENLDVEALLSGRILDTNGNALIIIEESIVDIIDLNTAEVIQKAVIKHSISSNTLKEAFTNYNNYLDRANKYIENPISNMNSFSHTVIEGLAFLRIISNLQTINPEFTSRIKVIPFTVEESLFKQIIELKNNGVRQLEKAENLMSLRTLPELNEDRLNQIKEYLQKSIIYFARAFQIESLQLTPYFEDIENRLSTIQNIKPVNYYLYSLVQFYSNDFKDSQIKLDQFNTYETFVRGIATSGLDLNKLEIEEILDRQGINDEQWQDFTLFYFLYIFLIVPNPRNQKLSIDEFYELCSRIFNYMKNNIVSFKNPSSLFNEFLKRTKDIDMGYSIYYTISEHYKARLQTNGSWDDDTINRFFGGEIKELKKTIDKSKIASNPLSKESIPKSKKQKKR